MVEPGIKEVSKKEQARTNWSSQLLQYKCDWCGREKKPHQAWIVGLAGERKGVTGSRRQVETLKQWNAEWAAHPLAVHFCSARHKDKYIDALFASPWRSASKSEAARAAFLRRNAGPNLEKISDAVIERHIADHERDALGQRNQAQAPERRRRSGPKNIPKNLFAATDTFYARSMGISLDSPGRHRDRASQS